MIQNHDCYTARRKFRTSKTLNTAWTFILSLVILQIETFYLATHPKSTLQGYISVSLVLFMHL